MHADYLELDLQMTKDGHLVAMHDDKVNRTTNGTGRVDHYTLAELKQLDAGSWFNQKYPKYQTRNMSVNKFQHLMKSSAVMAQVSIITSKRNHPMFIQAWRNNCSANYINMGSTVKKNLRNGKVVIQSFSRDSLKKVHHENPRIPLVQLLERGELPRQSNADLKKFKVTRWV